MPPPYLNTVVPVRPIFEPPVQNGLVLSTPNSEMQKAADAADISVLFFQLVLIFGPFWVIFGPIWEILGHFWC